MDKGCMETGKNDKILAIILGAGLAVLAVTVFRVLLAGHWSRCFGILGPFL